MKIRSRTQLVELMKELNLPLAGVEVGTAEGRFSRQLLELGMGKLYLVDIWERVPFIKGCGSFEQQWHDENYESVLAIEQDYPDRVTILKGFSYKRADTIPDGSLGMVYIDGDHTYEGVKTDIDSYWPKLVSGGIMAFHDYANYDYGVNRAVIEFVKGEANVNVIQEDGKIENIGAWIRK